MKIQARRILVASSLFPLYWVILLTISVLCPIVCLAKVDLRADIPLRFLLDVHKTRHPVVLHDLVSLEIIRIGQLVKVSVTHAVRPRLEHHIQIAWGTDNAQGAAFAINAILVEN